MQNKFKHYAMQCVQMLVMRTGSFFNNRCCAMRVRGSVIVACIAAIPLVLLAVRTQVACMPVCVRVLQSFVAGPAIIRAVRCCAGKRTQREAAVVDVVRPAVP